MPQWYWAGLENQWFVKTDWGFESLSHRYRCGAWLVMQRSPKPYYAGSSPVTSAFGLSPRWLRHSTLTAVFVGSNPTSPALYAVVMQKWYCSSLENCCPKGRGGSSPSSGVIYSISIIGQCKRFLISRLQVRVLYAVLWSYRQVVKTTVCKTVIVGSNPTVTSRM